VITGLENLGKDANTFVDQRNQVINQLSQLVDVSAIQSDNGLTLTTSNGTALVAGTRSFAFTTQLDVTGIQHVFSQGSDITSKLTGGKLAGLLQVREIIRLRLNAELTTLSACDSGVGKLQGQEGISNLVEAFLVAGSKSVVASLWSADDTFASALMEQFYRHLAQGEDTSSALRNAKLDLLAKYGDQVSPFYWAAFIAVGETSTPIGMRQQ